MVMKLETEELAYLVELKSDYDKIVYGIGEMKCKVHQTESYLDSLKNELDNHLSSYDVVIHRDREFASILNDKYGSGTINLETGEIS